MFGDQFRAAAGGLSLLAGQIRDRNLLDSELQRTGLEQQLGAEKGGAGFQLDSLHKGSAVDLEGVIRPEPKRAWEQQMLNTHVQEGLNTAERGMR